MSVGPTNRRALISGLGSAAVWPGVARAQQSGRTYRLAFISGLSHDNPLIAAFFDELRLSGMIEGQNLELIPGGFYRRYEELRETIPANVKSAPDAGCCARATSGHAAAPPRAAMNVRRFMWSPSLQDPAVLLKT